MIFQFLLYTCDKIWAILRLDLAQAKPRPNLDQAQTQPRPRLHLDLRPRSIHSKSYQTTKQWILDLEFHSRSKNNLFQVNFTSLAQPYLITCWLVMKVSRLRNGEGLFVANIGNKERKNDQKVFLWNFDLLLLFVKMIDSKLIS